MRRLAAFAGMLALAHGVHASLTSVNFVPETKALEIILVMQADDLETFLRRDTGRQIEIDRTPGAEKLVFQYIEKRLAFTSPSGARTPLKWVGMEISTQKVTAYLETQMPEGVEGMKIRNELLFDLLTDQVNMLSVKRGGKGKSSDHLFTAASGAAQQTVAWK